MTETLSEGAQRFQLLMERLGYPHRVTQLAASTRTAQQAAQAIGCRVEQICKSIVLVGEESQEAILVIASGANRIDEDTIAGYVGESVKIASPDLVRQRTGYAIGGVPPFGHLERLRTFIDDDLPQYSTVWAAAGHPHAVFELTPDDLLQMTGGHVARVKVQSKA